MSSTLTARPPGRLRLNMGCRSPGMALLLWCGWASAVSAGSLGVNPVRVTLEPGRTSGALTVRNDGPEPAVVQVEVQRWSQPAGAEQLEATRDLLATPPIFGLPAGASQIVRVGVRGMAPDGRQETAYRLLLKEVPPALAPETRGVRIALNISVPIFVLPTAAASAPGGMAPSLRWQARRADGGVRLRAENDGNVHVQVTGLLAGGERLPNFVPVYLLPGSHHEWLLRHDSAAGSPVPLVAYTDGGELSAQPAVTGP